MTLAGVVAILTAGGCSGGPDKAPAPPKVFGPEDRILSVGHVWREMTKSEGYPNQPSVAYMRVIDSLTFHFQDKSPTVLLDVDREELFRTPDGREFHCVVSGAINAPIRFTWKMEEAMVNVRVPETTLRRKCRERGFSKMSKRFDALTATYALRGDRLVAVDPSTLRSVLLPVR